MNFFLNQADARRHTLLWAFALGLVVGGTVLTGFSGRPAAAGGMSPVDELKAREDIRQQLVLYGILAQGDGNRPRDANLLVDTIMAPDVTSQQFFYDGTPAFPPRHGRENHKSSTMNSPDPAVGEQHFTVTVYFDEVTATTAKTRSQHMIVAVMHNVPGGDCNNACTGRVKRVSLQNYFDTWEKTPQGWLKKKTVIRSIS
jgi:hypothetical protein